MKHRTTVLFPMAFVWGAGLVTAACSDSSSSSPGTTDSGATSDASSDAPANTPDAQALDAGRGDADATVVTDSAIETGTKDTGAAETATTEAGTSETGTPDTGADAPFDSGTGSLAALPGYQVSVFATGGTTYKGPDSLELDGTHVWVGYQMGVKSKDGSDAGAPYSSTIVEYNLDGSLAGKSFQILGHADGVRVDPATHIVWATSNEDGNPVVMSFDPATDTSKTYTFGALPHGGGIDDLAFIGGKMIFTLSAPVADDAGIYSAPALVQVTANGLALTFTPILNGNSTATDLLADAGAPLSLTDPDSLSIDDKGQLVLVSQGDSELIFIKNPGGTDAGAQSVTKLSVGTQLDDTVWAKTGYGTLLVADATANTIYAIKSAFVPGTVYTETPDDSTIPGIVATVDLATGFIRPVVLGFKKPTGLIFVP